MLCDRGPRVGSKPHDADGSDDSLRAEVDEAGGTRALLEMFLDRQRAAALPTLQGLTAVFRVCPSVRRNVAADQECVLYSEHGY